MPRAPAARAVPHVGIIWRMSLRRGLVEAFAEPPSLAAVRGCLRKQLSLHHSLGLKICCLITFRFVSAAFY